MSKSEDQSNRQARLHAIIHGRVQGVNFRYHTTRTAQRLNVVGWVANRRDGTVEVIAEGPRKKLDKLVSFLHQGSPAAMVKDVDIDWETPTGDFGGFRVRYL
jgi:acylphosphatase